LHQCVRPGERGDLRGPGEEDLPLPPGRVVLRQPGDGVEEARALRVVEVLGGKLPRTSAEAVADVLLQRSSQIARAEQHLDADPGMGPEVSVEEEVVALHVRVSRGVALRQLDNSGSRQRSAGEWGNPSCESCSSSPPAPPPTIPRATPCSRCRRRPRSIHGRDRRESPDTDRSPRTSTPRRLRPAARPPRRSARPGTRPLAPDAHPPARDWPAPDPAARPPTATAAPCRPVIRPLRPPTR